MSDVTVTHALNPVCPPTAVKTYRAILVARGGRVVDMVPLHAGSEDEARREARDLIGEEDVIELWTGVQAVARFERDGMAPSRS